MISKYWRIPVHASRTALMKKTIITFFLFSLLRGAIKISPPNRTCRYFPSSEKAHLVFSDKAALRTRSRKNKIVSQKTGRGITFVCSYLITYFQIKINKMPVRQNMLIPVFVKKTETANPLNKIVRVFSMTAFLAFTE